MKSILLLFLILFSVNSFSQDDRETFLEKLARYTDVIDSLVQGSLDSRGLSPDTLFKPNVPSWDSVRDNINKVLKASKCETFDCPDYVQDFATLVNAKQAFAEELRVLRNPESFELRKELIENAQESIKILVWGIYDDETGKEFQEQLLTALDKNPALDIRIIVDGTIANIKGRKVLKQLERKSNGKIRIIKWKSRRYRANGTHRKLFIVDNKHVIIGGMNIGNPYSHKDPKNKWRDLDIYIKGERAGEVAQLQFVDVWNRQIVEFPKLEKKLGMLASVEIEGDYKGAPVLFVDQFPGSAVNESYHNIHTAIIKLFRNAQKSVDIENAYFIMDPVIRKEIEAVIKRGVKVRLFTNSEKSVDEKLISVPVLNSARDVLAMGAEVYLRETTTLHSKYMIVDNRIAMVGSYNFHPRSLRFDAENVAIVFDETLSRELTDHFENGISESRKVESPQSLKIDWNFLSIISEKFYFDFL